MKARMSGSWDTGGNATCGFPGEHRAFRPGPGTQEIGTDKLEPISPRSQYACFSGMFQPARFDEAVTPNCLRHGATLSKA